MQSGSHGPCRQGFTVERGTPIKQRVKHRGDLMQWFSTQAQEPGCHHASSAAYSLHVTLPRLLTVPTAPLHFPRWKNENGENSTF